MRIALLADGSLGHVWRWGAWFRDRGHDVLLLSFQDVSGCPFPARRLRRLLPTDLLGYAAAAPAVRRLLAGFRPHLVNAIYAGGYGFLGALSGTRPLVVTTIGSDMLVDYPSSAVHRRQIRFALGRAALVTTDAAVLTRAVVRAGVPPTRILEAVMGVDESIFHPPDAPREETVIASTRNLHPLYDVATLVEAVTDPAWPAGSRTIICGDGPERGALESRVPASGGRPAVTFTGRLAPDEIASVLRRASVYVSTSLSDSTSVSLLEAMACGAVPVVTDIEANREWIDDGENGLLFRPKDAPSLAAAVARICGDEGFASKARRENLELVGRRGLWRDNMARVEAAFASLAAGAEAR